MKRTTHSWTLLAHAALIAMGAGLVACGGGGDSGPAPSTLADLTLANRDTVAHASATGLLAMDAWALALAPILANSGGVAGLRDRPMAVITDPPYACPYGGQFILSANDLNNNAAWDIGEVVSVTYSDCRMTGSDILRGAAQITLLGSTSTSLNVKVSMSQLSDVSTESPPRHSLTLNGAINVDILTSPSSRIVATASGPVTATIRTHEFSDTVTLQSGFVEERTQDLATNGTAATLRGTLQSGGLGGGVLVNTDSPLTTLSADQYPSAGTLRITGNKGVMLMKAQSAGVTVELDYNDDGMVESTSAPTWDWLL
jgi:hypothetical protein